MVDMLNNISSFNNFNKLTALDITLSFLFVVISFLFVSPLLRSRRPGPLPPGPPSYPLIGNVLSIPSSHPWIPWASYKQKYGPISSLQILGQIFVLVNDQNIAMDFCERKATVYVERPPSCFAKL